MKKQLPTGVVVAIAVVALALVAFFGYRTIAGPGRAAVPNAKQVHTRAEQLALKSGGDFSKLTPEEQKTLNDITMGRGERYVQLHYQRLSSAGGK